jgi:hypothetical protein
LLAWFAGTAPVPEPLAISLEPLLGHGFPSRAPISLGDNLDHALLLISDANGTTVISNPGIHDMLSDGSIKLVVSVLCW